MFKRDPEADPYEVLRLPQETISGKDIDDCAHIVSCCIGKEDTQPGGGLILPRPFPTGPYGILSADGLFQTLKSANQIDRFAGEEVALAVARRNIASLRAGDLIFYYDVDKGRYAHVGMYMADVRKHIACHSYSRRDVSDEPQQEWDSVFVNSDAAQRKYTLCKVIG